MSKIIAQGAEAKIILSNNFIIKDRISKAYRLPELDKKIRKARTKAEAKLLLKASEIINSPKPFFQPCIDGAGKIKMPFIHGKKLSNSLDLFPLKKQKAVCKTIGAEIGKLHDAGIIHGDLTTSNMILVEKKDLNDKNINKKYAAKNNSSKNSALIIKNKFANVNASASGRWGENKSFSKIFLIDFGLGYISHKTEDKAVDLHLLKQALEAKHFKNSQVLWKQVENGYKNSKESGKVIERLKAVEKRGRYKDKY